MSYYNSLGQPIDKDNNAITNNKPDPLRIYDSPATYEGVRPKTPNAPQSPNDDYRTLTRELSLNESKREMMAHMREDEFKEFNNDTLNRTSYNRSQSAVSTARPRSARMMSTGSEPSFAIGGDAVYAVESNGTLVTQISVADDNELMHY